MPEGTKSYLAIRNQSEHSTFGFSVVKSATEARVYIQADQESADEDTDASTKTIPSSTDKTAETEQPERHVVGLMLKYVNLVFSFYPLIAVGTTMKAPLLDGYIERQILDPANRMFPVVEKTEGGAIYELDAAAMALTDKRLASFWALERGLSSLPHATFLSIVASFDSIFAEVVQHFLKLHPGRFDNGSQFLAVRDVLKLGSIEAVVDKVIKDEVFDLMRGSHDEQTDFAAEKLDVDIKGSWPRYGDFLELFERRNLIAHGERAFTLRYQDKLSAFKKVAHLGTVGSEVTIRSGYLRHSADILLEYGVLLIFSLWRKHLKHVDSESFAWVNIIATKAIAEGRNRAVSRILSYIIGIKSNAFSDQCRKMAVVNLANSLFKLEDREEAEKVLASTDWSAVSLDYTVCIAAIRDDAALVINLMEAAVKSNSLTPESFREWPAFDKMRSNPDFLEKYQALFGEPLIPLEIKQSESVPMEVESDLAVSSIQQDAPTEQAPVN